MKNIYDGAMMLKPVQTGFNISPAGEPVAYFHVRSSVETLITIWEKQAKVNGSRIICYIDEQLPEFLPFDCLKIQYCLDNLVSNAVKFSHNSVIKIIAGTVELSGGNQYFVLSVQDKGAGIDADKFNTIFYEGNTDPAQNLPNYGVIDTGLPMTKTVIEGMNGKILAKSMPGKGSTFSLILPTNLRSLNMAPVANCGKTSCIPSGFSHLNIMVVDDYNLNQLTIKALLHDTVNKIFFASHGYEALEILHSCPVDLILMDIHMPELDGIETTLRIRESGLEWANVKIIALTADPQYQHAHLCMKIGMNDALAKPIRKADLLHIFAKHCMTGNLESAC